MKCVCVEVGVRESFIFCEVPCVFFVDLDTGFSIYHHVSSGASSRFRWRDCVCYRCASFPAKCLAEKGVKPCSRTVKIMA